VLEDPEVLYIAERLRQILQPRTAS
jgi:hypothetical protein